MSAYHLDLGDERLPDLPADGAHTHTLDGCAHYRAGAEIGWLCGALPMFTAPEACPRCGHVMLADSLEPADELTFTDAGILTHLDCTPDRSTP